MDLRVNILLFVGKSNRLEEIGRKSSIVNMGEMFCSLQGLYVQSWHAMAVEEVKHVANTTVELIYAQDYQNAY